MIYGYVRISTRKQSLERQIQNIKAVKPEAVIIQEVFTGRTQLRPKWQSLKGRLKAGDIIIFDSVSRMSRNAAEGIAEYEELYNKGVTLQFLKEPYINTDIYKGKIEAAAIDIDLQDKSYLKPLLNGLEGTLKLLAREQIVIAFNQSEKEVKDLSERTRERLAILKAEGVKLGQRTGRKLITKKSIEVKDKMRRLLGTMSNEELIRLLKISRNTFYKYLRNE